MTNNIDLSIVILNYNTIFFLRKLLNSLKKSFLGKYKIETIIIDNASVDKSREMVKTEFPWVKLIKNTMNLGYAKANNQGVRVSRGSYLLFLNSDTLLERKTLFKMLTFMEENKAYAAATCKVELINRKLDPACHRGFPTPWAAFTYFTSLEYFFPHSKIFGQYHQTWKNLKKIHEVDVISGCFFLIRKETLDKVGLFDERFFVYAEDIDLCLRLKNVNYKIAFNPNTKIIHYKTSSGRKIYKGKKITLDEKRTRLLAKKHFFETMKLFYDKHYKNKYPFWIRWLILSGIKVISLVKD